MDFDKWFYSQDRLVKIILIILPVIGWIIEVLVRLSALLRKTTNTNIIGFVLFLLLGGLWIPTIIDVVYFVLYDKFLLLEA